MPKFRQKLALFEAIQLRWDTWSEMCDFADVGKLEDGKPTGCYIGPDGQPLPDGKGSEEMGMLIPTRKGLLVARQNDWIVRDPRIKGELYSCNPELFEAVFELVED